MNPIDKNYQVEAIRWLFEMELLDDPRAITTLKMNILAAYPKVKEVEFLILLPPKREMLVFIQMGWLARKFYTKRYEAEIADTLRQFVPKYAIKVTTDLVEFEAARTRVKQYLSKQG